MKQSLPLEGISVVEFSHMVMGPTCGMMMCRSAKLRRRPSAMAASHCPLCTA